MPARSRREPTSGRQRLEAADRGQADRTGILHEIEKRPERNLTMTAVIIVVVIIVAGILANAAQHFGP